MKRARIAIALALVIVWIGLRLRGAGGELVEHPIGTTDAPYGWIEYLPPRYDGVAPLPLVIVLHGQSASGDGSSPLGAVTRHPPLRCARVSLALGLVPALASREAVFVAPQSPGRWDVAQLDAFVDHVLATRAIDRSRIYVTGISMGGVGAWEYAAAHPERLAAVMPVCGASLPEPDGAARIGSLPVRAFHAFDDDVVPNHDSAAWFAAIAAVRGGPSASPMLTYPSIDHWAAATDVTAIFEIGSVRWEPGTHVSRATRLSLTMFRTGGHAIWASVYGDDASWDWLFAQRRD